KGDVPARPEIDHVLRAPRLVEVLLKPQANHQAEAERNVGQSREQKVETQPVDRRGGPQDGEASVLGWADDVVGNIAHELAQNDRHGQAEQDSLGAAEELLRAPTPSLALPLEMR